MRACNSTRAASRPGSWPNRPDARFAQVPCPICSRRNVDQASISAGTRCGGSSASSRPPAMSRDAGCARPTDNGDGRSNSRIRRPRRQAHLRTVNGSAVDGSTTSGRAIDGSGADRMGDQLRYPECLRRVPVDSLRGLLGACPMDLRQPMLDEVDAMHKVGKVRNPIGLVSVLARKAGLGRFAPNYSIQVDRSRPVAARGRSTNRRYGIAIDRADGGLGARPPGAFRSSQTPEFGRRERRRTRDAQEGGGEARGESDQLI